jgi:hypothetical protein
MALMGERAQTEYFEDDIGGGVSTNRDIIIKEDSVEQSDSR